MEKLGIIISPSIKKCTQLFFHLDRYFFYFPNYSHLVCLDNKIMKEIAASYHFQFNPVKTNAEIISKSNFLFIFGGELVSDLSDNLVKYKGKTLIIN